MKNKLLICIVLSMTLLLGGCTTIKDNVNNSNDNNKGNLTEENKNEGNNNESGGIYLSDNELEEINKKHEENIKTNMKYKFGKVVSLKGTLIEIEYVTTPDGYYDIGSNDDLKINTSKLKSLGEKDSIELLGVQTNFTDLSKVREGIYLRVGVYDSTSGNGEGIFREGEVMSLDIVTSE